MREKRQSRIEPGQGEMGRLEFLYADHSIEGSLVFKSIPCTFVVLWATRKLGTLLESVILKIRD